MESRTGEWRVGKRITTARGQLFHAPQLTPAATCWASVRAAAFCPQSPAGPYEQPSFDVHVTPSRNERIWVGSLTRFEIWTQDPASRAPKTPVEFPLDQHSIDWGTTWTFVTTHGFLDSLRFFPMGRWVSTTFAVALHASGLPTRST
jgi:hypothetical protein